MLSITDCVRPSFTCTTIIFQKSARLKVRCTFSKFLRSNYFFNSPFGVIPVKKVDAWHLDISLRDDPYFHKNYWCQTKLDRSCTTSFLTSVMDCFWWCPWFRSVVDDSFAFSIFRSNFPVRCLNQQWHFSFPLAITDCRNLLGIYYSKWRKQSCPNMGVIP